MPIKGELRRRGFAKIGCFPASWMEVATGRRPQWRRQFALQIDAGFLPARIGDRGRRQKSSRIGMFRVGKNLGSFAGFHRTTKIHDHHIIGDVLQGVRAAALHEGKVRAA